MVTTSRRTGENRNTISEKRLRSPNTFLGRQRPQPYMGLLAWARHHHCDKWPAPQCSRKQQQPENPSTTLLWFNFQNARICFWKTQVHGLPSAIGGEPWNMVVWTFEPNAAMIAQAIRQKNWAFCTLGFTKSKSDIKSIQSWQKNISRQKSLLSDLARRYTAAIYAARANLEPVLVTGMEQGGN